MATYIEINGNKYSASITGRLRDQDWDNRASKAIELEMKYADAIQLFVDNIQWNILQDVEVNHDKINEDGDMIVETVIEQEAYDNSDYCVAGDIIDHRDGTITVKMGKPTTEELLAEMDLALMEATYKNLVGGVE